MNLQKYFVKVGKKVKILMIWYLVQVDVFKKDNTKVGTVSIITKMIMMIHTLQRT